MDIKKTLYEADERALENGITATLSIQFTEEPNGKMSVLSCSIIQGYQNDDYCLSLETQLKDIIKDLIR